MQQSTSSVAQVTGQRGCGAAPHDQTAASDAHRPAGPAGGTPSPLAVLLADAASAAHASPRIGLQVMPSYCCSRKSSPAGPPPPPPPPKTHILACTHAPLALTSASVTTCQQRYADSSCSPLYEVSSSKGCQRSLSCFPGVISAILGKHDVLVIASRCSGICSWFTVPIAGPSKLASSWPPYGPLTLTRKWARLHQNRIHAMMVMKMSLSCSASGEGQVRSIPRRGGLPGETVQGVQAPSPALPFRCLI